MPQFGSPLPASRRRPEPYGIRRTRSINPEAARRNPGRSVARKEAHRRPFPCCRRSSPCKPDILLKRSLPQNRKQDVCVASKTIPSSLRQFTTLDARRVHLTSRRLFDRKNPAFQFACRILSAVTCRTHLAAASHPALPTEMGRLCPRAACLPHRLNSESIRKCNAARIAPETVRRGGKRV
jgi:hypothetical protein